MCKLFVVPRCELGMLKTEKASDRCEVYYMKETISDRLVFPKTKQKETNQKTKNRTMRIVGSPMRFVFFGFVLFFCVLLFLSVFFNAFYVFRWQFPHMCQTRGSEYRCLQYFCCISILDTFLELLLVDLNYCQIPASIFANLLL